MPNVYFNANVETPNGPGVGDQMTLIDGVPHILVRHDFNKLKAIPPRAGHLWTPLHAKTITCLIAYLPTEVKLS
jgi:hypothetical protein